MFFLRAETLGEYTVPATKIESIPLTTNKTIEEVFWYVSSRHQKLPRLNLATHNGKIKVTAYIKMDCDSVEIYVH